MNAERIKVWFLQVRGPFLLLAVVLVFLGIAMARHDGMINWIHAILLMIGVVQTHIAVNLFNELSDYRTGIDSKTKPTPFSGGSGMMQAGNTTPQAVTLAAYFNMFMAGAIGIYFCIVSTWLIFPLMIAGGLAIRFYTSHLARWMIGEIVAGLTLGSFVVMGVYMALTGRLTLPALLVSVPPGILTLQLLFLNEFPDADMDKAGGRHHWVIHFGRAKSAIIYGVLNAVLYTFILILPWIGRFPKTIWLGLSTLPLGIVASIVTWKNYHSVEKLIPAMGLNVMIVLLTDALLGAGLLIA